MGTKQRRYGMGSAPMHDEQVLSPLLTRQTDTLSSAPLMTLTARLHVDPLVDWK